MDYYKSDIPSMPSFNRAAQICSGIVVAFGVMTLLGWTLSLRLLASIRSDYIPMAPNTAAMFILAGISLLILTLRPVHHISRWFTKAAIALVFLLSLLILIQYFADIDLGFDRLLISTHETLGRVPVGVASPISATNFLLTDFSLLLTFFTFRGKRQTRGAASALATVVVLIGSVVILGYLYGTPLLYGGTTVPMALTTAIAFVCMGIGLIASAGQQQWPLRLVIGSSTRARLLCAFLPVMVTVILFKGWLDTVAVSQSGSNPALISALLAILSIVIVTVIISRIASRIGNTIDQTKTRLVNLADRDPLTSLLNSRCFQEELEAWLAYAKRYKISGVLLFIDLDNFKYVNDTSGHQAGDTLLKTIASLLRKRIRATDTLARLGGDEFAIILPHTDLKQSLLVAQEMLDLVRRSTSVKEGEFFEITASIGITLFPQHGNTAETLLANADLAMYQAKEEGRNRICVYSPDRKTEIESRLIWKKRIHDAIKHDHFVLHLLPILDLKHNRIGGYEALLRMLDKTGNLIPPADFLAIAERFGLVHQIDQWVVCKAIRMIVKLFQTGNVQYININFSDKVFANPELISTTRQELAASGINPLTLVPEISESALIENIDEAHHFISSFKTLGCRFALDNFGNGFSSFNHLKKLPVDYLKIDGSLIRNLTHNQTDQHLVKAMVEVARGLGKQTIAKYVECDKTIRLLKQYGVDYAQGYQVGQPIAASELLGNSIFKH